MGHLVTVGHEEVTVELDAAVAAGDTLEVGSIRVPMHVPMCPNAGPRCPARWMQRRGERVVVHCKRKVDEGCEVYLIRSAGVLEQTATALEHMRVEADAVVPVARAVEMLPFEGAVTVGDVPEAALAEPTEKGASARMVFAWQLMDADPCGERDLSDATVVLDEVCRAADASRTRSLMRRAGRVVCRNLGQVALARELGVAFDVAAPVFLREPGYACLATRARRGPCVFACRLVADDVERVAELAACPGVLGPVDADPSRAHGVRALLADCRGRLCHGCDGAGPLP